MMMIHRKGTSPLAALADGLPVRARIGLALVAGDIALSFIETPRNRQVSVSALDIARRWFDGKRVDPDQIQDALYDEESGLSLILMYVDEKQEEAAMIALGSVLLYTAYHAYQHAGGCPNASVCEVDESELDEIDKWLRIIAPSRMELLRTAARYLENHPDIAFRDLKAAISGC
jgi:hypothetical protein